jgi:hypothetical protein
VRLYFVTWTAYSHYIFNPERIGRAVVHASRACPGYRGAIACNVSYRVAQKMLRAGARECQRCEEKPKG